jgi:hypothetical protein
MSTQAVLHPVRHLAGADGMIYLGRLSWNLWGTGSTIVVQAVVLSPEDGELTIDLR